MTGPFCIWFYTATNTNKKRQHETETHNLLTHQSPGDFRFQPAVSPMDRRALNERVGFVFRGLPRRLEGNDTLGAG